MILRVSTRLAFRALALFVVAAIFLSGAARAAEPSSQPPWYERMIVGMEVGPTGAQFGSDPSDVGYAARFNGAEVVRRCAAAHCEYVVIWARDGEYAYYNSKIMPPCPGLAGRDVVREAVEAARPLGMPVIAYCVVQQGGHFLTAHPEFQMREADGAKIDRYCLNSPGYLEVMEGLLDEMLELGVDGFHVDMLDQGFGPPYGCWCDRCKASFREEFGRAMPGGVTWDEDWGRMLEFRYRTSQRFELALRDHLRKVRPGATVDFNYHGNPPFSWEVGQRPVQHAGNADFVTGETGVWGFSALTVGLNAAFYAAATPGRPFQVAMQRGVRMYHDQTTRPLNDMRWELMTLLTHGAFVTIVDKTAYDGGLDPVAYGRMGEALGEARAKRGEFGQAQVMDVGIYFSSRSRDWVGRAESAKWFQNFLGAHKAMAYEHIPWGVILDESADLATLRRFPVVCLPNVEVISEKEAALFREYVEQGGSLIVTGWTALDDAMGKPRQGSALAGLIGAEATGRLDSTDNHVRFPSTPSTADGVEVAARMSEGIPPDWPFLVEGPATIYKPKGGQAIGELMRPHRTVRQRQGKEGTPWPMSAGEPVGPAILLNRVGKGSVLTFACSPDAATAGEHHIVEARRLLRNAARLLVPEPRIRVEAPSAVESVVTDDPKTRTLRVHLLGYYATPGTIPARERPYVLPGLIEDAPMFRATIETSADMRNASAWNASTELHRGRRRIEATINDVHEVIAIEY